MTVDDLALISAEEYPHAGQNLAITWFSIDFGFTDETLEDDIQAWYDEVKDAVMAHIEECGGGPKPT